MNIRLILAALVAMVAPGCDSGSLPAPATGVSATPATAPAPSSSGYKVRLTEDLPTVGDALPPLDDGRIEIAGPQGWRTLPRNSREYLVGFVPGQASQLPRIVVTVKDPPAGLEDTTEDNAHQLAESLDAGQRSNAKLVVPEHCLPIILGDRTFVRHVRLARMDGDPVVIQSLQTVAGGRLYSVELICAVNAADGREYASSLKEHRDQGYAVAANMKFTAGATSLVEAQPKEDPQDAQSPE
jgi:hypothetical protein